MPSPASTSTNQQTRTPWPWLRERLFPRGTNLIQLTSYVILIGLTIIQVLQPPENISQLQFTSTLVTLAVLLVINILWDDIEGLFPSKSAGKWVLVFISALLAFYLIGYGQMFSAVYILFMISAQANAMLPSRPAIAFSVLLGVGFMVILLAMGVNASNMSNTLLGVIIGLTFTVTLSQVLVRYAEQTKRANLLLEQLRQANSELMAARQREKELAIAEERVRVARDLHDGLGHHLTALSVQLQAAEKILRANPDLAADALRNARGEVQAALKEVRQSVAALREMPVDFRNLPQALEALAAETGQRSGIEAQFRQEGQTAELLPTAAMTIFRAAQEGLTNVQKHAAGVSQVKVILSYSEEEVKLTVEDNGDIREAATEGGFGLAGLRERASLLGGRLDAAPKAGGGFRLCISLPSTSSAAGGAE
jgi:signal transduction histidine kinase